MPGRAPASLVEAVGAVSERERQLQLQREEEMSSKGGAAGKPTLAESSPSYVLRGQSESSSGNGVVEPGDVPLGLSQQRELSAALGDTGFSASNGVRASLADSSSGVEAKRDGSKLLGVETISLEGGEGLELGARRRLDGAEEAGPAVVGGTGDSSEAAQAGTSFPCSSLNYPPMHF